VSHPGYSIDDYDYDLPRELIAQEPLADRSGSRLMVVDRRTGAIGHHVFRDLPSLLAPGDLLVTNRSRVIPARLLGRRPGGGDAEVLLVRQRGADEWDALVRPGRRLREGARVDVAPGFRIHILAAGGGRESTSAPLRLVRLEADAGDTEAAIQTHGHVPLPPYITRGDAPADRERYQTVYATDPGSVAAPTAGLHFTPDLLAALDARGVERTELTLHVGPGTFRPVEVADIREHRVDAEVYEVPEATAWALDRARQERRRVVAVGTTTTRVLETVVAEAAPTTAGPGETSLVVVPGHGFRAVGALVTNFHLPRSSLLLLVSAFAGPGTIRRAYAEAIRERYRFYSYGDAMLIL